MSFARACEDMRIYDAGLAHKTGRETKMLRGRGLKVYRAACALLCQDLTLQSASGASAPLVRAGLYAGPMSSYAFDILAILLVIAALASYAQLLAR